MTKLTDVFRGYATPPQNRCIGTVQSKPVYRYCTVKTGVQVLYSQKRCIGTVQSKAKLICSGLTLRKWQAHGCENLKQILSDRKYSRSDTGCCTADVGCPTLLSAATCRTEFLNFPITPRKAEKSKHQVWLCKINSNTRFVCLFLARQPPPSGPVPPHSRGFQMKHNDTPQSVGLLWTSDQLVAETSTL